MIGRIGEGGPGSSFKGAAAYYLHDKQNSFNRAAGTQPSTNERVAWVETLNLATDDPELAWKIMAATALSQNEIKSAAGLKSGKRCTNPVYSYSLSWTFDDPVDREEMMRAAKETLQVLGFADRQALIICHSDEPQPHIHIIVNRVHPETGRADHEVPAMVVGGVKYKPRTRELSNDRLVLSRWAQAYQKQRGQDHLTPERTKNNKKRDKGEFVKDKRSLSRLEYELRDAMRGGEWQARKSVLVQARMRRAIEMKNLLASQAGQRAFMRDERRAKIAELNADLKARAKPQWAALFARHDQEKAAHDRKQKALLARLRSPEQRELSDALIRARHGKEGQALADKLRIERRDVLSRLDQGYDAQNTVLADMQRGERDALAAQHSQQSQRIAKAIKNDASAKELRVLAGLPKESGSSAQTIATSGTRVPPAPRPQIRPAIGEDRKRIETRRLEVDHRRRVDERIATLRRENRPRWAALFARQREQTRAFNAAQSNALTRLIYHLREHKGGERLSALGMALSVLGAGRDRHVLEAQQVQDRRALSLELRQQQDRAIAREERQYHRERDRIAREAQREAAAFEKAVEEGQTKATRPRQTGGSHAAALGDEFNRQMREKLKEIERREEERRKRDRGNDRGRER